MPYEVKKNGDQYCVYKKSEKSPIKGGCHPTRQKALKHMRALYVNVEGKTVDPPTTMDEAKDLAANLGWTLEPMEGTPYWALRNVPIASTGIEYPLSTGPHTFTPEDLAAAVDAQDDPAIVQPRIWLGHDDPRFNGDGEPALGRVEAMRLSDDGHTIFGDYVGLPAWLAKIMPVAYPSRSIEGQVNASTVTGKKYPLVITAVKQLGVIWPGISVLEDIPILLSDSGPKDVKIAATKAIAAEVNVEDVRREFYDQLKVEAEDDPEKRFWWIRVQQVVSGKGQLIVDDDNGQLYRVGYKVTGDSVKFDDPVPVRVQYQDQSVAASAVSEMVSEIEEPVLIYASRKDSWENGELAAATVTDAPWDGTSSRFSDEQYVTACVLDRADCSLDWKNMPDKQRFTLPIREPDGALNRNAVHAAAERLGSFKACVAAKSRAAAQIKAAYGTLKEDPPDDVMKLAASTNKGGSMDEETRQLLAAKLGLPADSTEEQIDAHLAKLKASTETPTPPTPETPPPTPPSQPTPETPPSVTDDPEGDKGDGEGDKGNGENVEAKQQGVVQVDAATWDEIRSNAALAAKMHQDNIKAENDRTITDAIKAGKFPPSRKDHYMKLMAADREGTIAMINGLEVGTIPVNERGSSGGSEELKAGMENGNVANGEGLPDNWFPEVGMIKARALQDRRIFQAKEG